MTSLVKPTHSHVKRPFVRKTAVKNKVWVPTVRTKFPTVGPKVPTARPTVAADKGNKGKAVKASACWIWKPKQNQPDQGSNLNGVSVIFKKYKYIDTQGRPKSVMAWSYQTSPKEYDGKGGAVVYTRWIENMESVQDMSGCGDNQKVKYIAGSFVGKALTWEEFCPSNEMQKLETELWNHALVGDGHVAYTDRFHELASMSWVESSSKARGNHQNQVVAVNGGQGRRNNSNQARGRAFMLGAEEARQDPNIMTGIESNDLGFSYEIEIASG
ncbi:hypothetical protein Tco_0918718 [Tanacetum coccineum]